MRENESKSNLDSHLVNNKEDNDELKEGENVEEEEEEEWISDDKEEYDDNNYDDYYDDFSNVLSLNSTQKIIIIYGIAAGMSYLHSHNILHRDIMPNNIYLNDSLFPKISRFNIAKDIKNDLIDPNDTIKEKPACIAPGIYLKKGYSKSSDAYSFSLIVWHAFEC
ncbi:hypothetical protein M9Y10_000669 [Tritrichomonas musculus]|uniref:Protein kinase domain-containing protein n=1 Tax=Tritrichomonas musculus TaxID=1915356 RepID=A0ABR2L4W8_9EUKA